MTVISTKEFNTDQEKYFDMAANGNVCIKNDKYMFYLVCRPVEQDEEYIVFEPNDELRSCITMDEVRTRTREGIHQFFADKQQ